MVCKNSTKDFWHDSASLKLVAGCFILISYLILPYLEAVRFMRKRSEAKDRLPIIYGKFQRNIITYKQTVILVSMLSLIAVSLPVLQYATNVFDINIKIYLLNIHLATAIFYCIGFPIYILLNISNYFPDFYSNSTKHKEPMIFYVSKPCYHPRQLYFSYQTKKRASLTMNSDRTIPYSNILTHSHTPNLEMLSHLKTNVSSKKICDLPSVSI